MSGRFFTHWVEIRIRIQAEADSGSGSVFKRMGIHIAALLNMCAQLLYIGLKSIAIVDDFLSLEFENKIHIIFLTFKNTKFVI